MTEESTYAYKYQGGSLPANDPTYVKRKADDELYHSLKVGRFCYVLNSRQMGKSSLRVRTMKRLQANGTACAAIDLTATGSQITSEQWYKGIAYRLFRTFARSIQIDWKQWWKDRDFLSGVQRLSEIIDEILLESISENIVIFIDEIDSVIGLDFPTDDFFAFIRSCYNQRVDNPKYNRLTFCLLGVATPSTLIEDKRRTPFNIGQAIELKGFKLEEAQLSLTKGFTNKVDNPQQVLAEVLFWTGGQPFLTQKLCQLVVEAETINPDITELVQTHLIDNWEARDEPEHLRTIRDRILYNKQRAAILIELYQRIYSQSEIETTNSYEEVELRLSGLVVKQQGKLKIANPIYQEIFNKNWIDKQLSSFWFFEQEWKELDTKPRLPPSTAYLAKILSYYGILLIICGISLASSYHLFGSEPWIKDFGEYGSLIDFIRGGFLLVGHFYLVGIVWRKEVLEILQSQSKSAKLYRFTAIFLSIFMSSFFLYHLIYALPQQTSGYEHSNQKFRDYYLPTILYFPYAFIIYFCVALPFCFVSVYAAFQAYNQSLKRTIKLNYRLKEIEKNFNILQDKTSHIVKIINRNYTRYTWGFINDVAPYISILIIIEIVRNFEFRYGLETMTPSGQRWMGLTYFVSLSSCLVIIMWNFSLYQQALTKTSYCLSKLQADTIKFEADNNVLKVLLKIIRCQFNICLMVILFIFNVITIFSS